MDSAQQDLTTINEFHAMLVAQPASVPLDLLKGYVDAVERMQAAEPRTRPHVQPRPAAGRESPSSALDAFDAMIRTNSVRSLSALSLGFAAMALVALAIVAFAPGTSP